MNFLTVDDFTQFLADFPQVQFVRSLFCGDDHIMTTGEVLFVETIILTEKAFASIPLDRVSRPFADCDPQPLNSQPVLLGDYDKMSRMAAFARPIKIDKVSSIQ